MPAAPAACGVAAGRALGSPQMLLAAHRNVRSETQIRLAYLRDMKRHSSKPTLSRKLLKSIHTETLRDLRDRGADCDADVLVRPYHRCLEDEGRGLAAVGRGLGNGSRYTARETRALAREISLVPRRTPIENPQSNGMAEAFIKTLKRDYAKVAARPDAGQRTAPARLLVRPIQHRGSAQGARLPLAARVPETVEGEGDRKRGRRCASTA